jgi:hypothetical protein
MFLVVHRPIPVIIPQSSFAGFAIPTSPPHRPHPPMTTDATLLFGHAPGPATLPDVIVRRARDGRYLWISDSIECATGIPPARFVGRTSGEAELPHGIGGGRWSSLMDEVFRTGRAARLAFTVEDGGATRCLELRVMPDLGGADGVASVTGVVRDVTELLDEAAGTRHRRETGAGAAEREGGDGPDRARLMEAVGRAAGSIAHDVNNVLMAIKGGVELMLGSGTLSEDQLDDLNGIDAAADRAAALTERLLAFGCRQPRQPRVVELSEIVARVERTTRGGLGPGVELRVERDPAPASVLVDEGQMERVLLELIQNARDAMPGGGTIRVSTRAEAGEGGSPGVTLSVGDTGEGIAPEVLPMIFDPFFTTRRKGIGAGLGLSTVYGIVRQSGGTCDVHSVPGAGTRVVVHLPLAASASASAAPEPGPSSPSLGPPAGHELVLLVEGDDSVRSVARRILLASGYRVREARTPAEAVSMAGDEPGPIHLVLTDVVLAGVGGAALAQRIRELHPEARVLFMSGHHDAPSGHGVDRGAAIVRKPFTVDGLRESVREVLRPAA